MSNSQDWVEALNISPENLSEWSQSVPAETPLLVWCLEKGFIPKQDYFAWARERYGLPTLNPHYFASGFDVKNLADARQQGDWSPWCFPVGQWEDVTLIACVEPPSNLPDGNFALVLAEPGPLRELWNSTNPNTDTKVPLPQAKAKAQVELDTPPPMPVPDGPVGINLSGTSSFHLNLDALEGAVEYQAEVHSAADAFADSDAPPAIELTGSRTGVTLSIISERSAPITQEESLPIKVMPEATPPPVTKPTPIVQAKPPAAATPAAAPSRPSTKPPTKPTNIPGGAKAPVGDLDSEIKLAFDRIKHLYRYALVLHCENGVATPYKWDADVKLAKAADAAVNLNNPSFLRIVAKTQQLYHGYVVDSPAHKAFFQALGMPANPACVTAIPLKVDDQLWGMLVALGTEAAQGNDAIEVCQTVAEKLISAIAAKASKAS